MNITQQPMSHLSENTWASTSKVRAFQKGPTGGPEVPAGFYVVATMIFTGMDKPQAALEAAGLVLADIPNFTNSEPKMLIGEIIS
jgi:hypothetical protein